MEKLLSFKKDKILIYYDNYENFTNSFIIPFLSELKNVNLEKYILDTKKNVYKMIDLFKNENEKEIDNNNMLNIIGEIFYFKENYEKAFEYYKKSNNSDALNNLGILYQNGFCVEENYKKAAEYYKKSNTRDAYFNLGVLYDDGLGVEQNIEKAIEYYQKSNTRNALNNLGVLYQYGSGVEQNTEKAIEYYKKSNNSNAYYNLGLLYEDGINIKEDYEKSIEYYDMASNNNIVEKIYLIEFIDTNSLKNLYYKLKNAIFKEKILDVIQEEDKLNPYELKYIKLYLDGIKNKIFDKKKLNKRLFMLSYKDYMDKMNEAMSVHFKKYIRKDQSFTITSFL